MKKLIALFLALLLLLTMAACERDEGVDDTQSGKSEPTTESNGNGDTTDPIPSETQEPTCGVFLPTEMVKTIHNEDGDAIWREVYTYDLQGNRISTTSYKPDGSVSSVCTMEYDEKGNMIRETYASGSVYEYAYDSLGNQYCTLSFGKTAELELDDQGRALRLGTDTFTYAEDMSSYTRYQYTAAGELSEYTEYILDAQGHVVTTRRCHGDGKLLYRTDYVYENGHMVQMLSYGMNSENHVSTSHAYTYDAYGNMLTDTFTGNYYSSDYEAVYTITEIEVTESAAQRLGQ